MARRRLQRSDLIWSGNEWRRGWEIALMRIKGAPTAVSEHIAFHHAIDMLDSAFVRGDAFQFQLGLIMILDCCNEAIERGDCSQWWVDKIRRRGISRDTKLTKHRSFRMLITYALPNSASSVPARPLCM